MTSRRFALALLLFAATSIAAEEEASRRLELRPVLMFNQYLYAGTMSRPHGIAYDAGHSELWVADGGHGIIGIFRPDGTEIFSFGSKKYLKDPTRLAVSPKGRIAVIEGDRAHVRLFSYRGDYLGDLPLPGIDAKPIIGAIAWDRDGLLYVAENRSAQIFVYGTDGKLRLQFGSRGTDEGQFRSVCAIAPDSDGNIWVVDQQALAVQQFDSQGNFLRGWGKHEMGGEHFSLPSGIALDSKGHVFVSDELRHQVKIFAKDGKFLGNVGGLGDGAGQLSFPTDVAVDEKDRVYVSERGTFRVQVFEPVNETAEQN